MIGQFWIAHAHPYIRSRQQRGRRTGWSLLLLAGVMIASGYLLQISVEPQWRTAWIWVHGVSCLLWIAVLFMHLLRHRLKHLRSQGHDHRPIRPKH